MMVERVVVASGVEVSVLVPVGDALQLLMVSACRQGQQILKQ